MMDDFDPSLPLERARTIPARWYTDAVVLERELATVFAGWQAVARTDQLADVGSYATADVAGEPVAVVRGTDGQLRAFHNVCRHRAAPVLLGCGTANRLRCRYHGWTYDLAGRLRGAPEFEGVEDFDRDANGLVAMAVDAWGPTVWVHPGTPRQSLAEFLNPMPTMTKEFGIDRLHWHARREYVLGCNWKVYADNYLDGGYHIHSVHPGLSSVIDYAKYRTETFAHSSVQLSPLKPADAVEGAVRTGATAHYWWVYPNFMVNLYSGVMDTNLVMPLGPDRCRVVFDFYFADGTDAAYKETSLSVAEQVQQEDVSICEEVQRGLHSRSYSMGRFSVKRENAGYHFHRLLAASLQIP